MLDWARKKMQFLAAKCISATKKKRIFSSVSKVKIFTDLQRKRI